MMSLMNSVEVKLTPLQNTMTYKLKAHATVGKDLHSIQNCKNSPWQTQNNNNTAV